MSIPDAIIKAGKVARLPRILGWTVSDMYGMIEAEYDITAATKENILGTQFWFQRQENSSIFDSKYDQYKMDINSKI